MFAYSLSGLQLDDAGGTTVTEVEENETTARSAVYQVLASLLVAPDQDLADRVADGRLNKDFDTALELLPYSWVPGDIEQAGLDDPTSLRAAYDATIGEGAESLLTERRWVADPDHAISDAERSYQYFGLGAPADAAVPVDHLTAQLDYMQFLTFKEAASTSPRLARSFQRAQREFLEGHLSAWLPVACDSSELAGAPAWSRWVLGRVNSFIAADQEYATA